MARFFNRFSVNMLKIIFLLILFKCLKSQVIDSNRGDSVYRSSRSQAATSYESASNFCTSIDLSLAVILSSEDELQVLDYIKKQISVAGTRFFRRGSSAGADLDIFKSGLGLNKC